MAPTSEHRTPVGRSEDADRRWTIYVCTGCGQPTGRHNNCDAKREATPVVPCDNAAKEHAARLLKAEVERRNEHYGLDNWAFSEVVEFCITGLAAST